eukprot:6213981-Pleurochrysis_carterae.AAC.3
MGCPLTPKACCGGGGERWRCGARSCGGCLAGRVFISDVSSRAARGPDEFWASFAWEKRTLML